MKDWNPHTGEYRNPIRNKAWRGEREWYEPTECDFCGGNLGGFEHEALWDHIRRIFYNNRSHGYLWMPPWMPRWVCAECAEYLTPFVFTLCDLALLQNYNNQLERITTRVKLSKGRSAPINWSAPLSACECSDICHRWFAGDRKSYDAPQALEEYQ